MSDSAAGMDTAPQEPQSPAEVGDSENRHLAPVPNVGARKSGISVLDRLIKTCPVWLQLCMSSEKAVEILRQEAAGVFLVTRDADLDRLVLWVHVPAHTETCDVLRYNIKEEKSMRFLEGSVLVFEDIFKLVAFYCVSRDVFPSTLKLPQAIAGAQSCSDLETISNLGTGFWDLSLTDKRDLGISPPVSACGSILANSVKPAAHMSSDTNDCSCEIEISAGNDKLWFVNPIFIEEFSNARAPDKLPLVNCVANPEVKAPKVVYRRPPPPPPLQNPPLPFLPPSAPPNNYLLSSPLQSPPLSSSFSPPLPSPFPPPFLNTLPSSSPPHELLSLCSSPYVAPPPPSLPPSVHPSSTPPQALFVPPSPPISHTLETSSQLKDSSEISSIIWVDMHLAPPSCEEMKINNSEDNKGSGGDDSSLLVAQTEKPGVVPPVVPRRRQSEKLSEVNPNSLGKKEELHMKESQNSSNIPSVMTILEPRSKKQADAHLIHEKATSQREEVSSPEPQCTSPGKEKRCPPVPPPRTKRLSRQFSSISTVDGKPATKKGTAQQCSRTTRAQRNCSSVQPAASGKGTDEASVKTLPSKKLKGCETSLNSPASGSGARTTNPEQDSFSNSSTEDDVERLTSPSIKKTQSFMLDRARNRLSIVSISNVFTAFMSADRKLQKRITELAQDKDSYFGNLVQDYKTYSLEMMAKQSSSTEMLQEIRMMMTQLKSYLVQSTELKSMVDFSLYTDEKIEAVVEAALCKCVLKSLKCPIESYLREIHSKDGSLRLLTENQMVIQETTSTDLGVTTSVPEMSVMEKITQKFATMHKTYSPEKKITYLLKSCKLIYDSMSTGSPGKPHGADDFLPVLMYVLARCDLAALLLDVEYMMELMDPALQLGEGSYYLTTTYGALEHIKYYDKITVTRQLSVEVQDSIHRWERRRTLNKARVSRSSVQDFITISFEEPDSKTRTLVTKPDTSAALLLQECAEKFEVCEPERYGLFVLVKDRYLRLSTDALPHHIKSQLLKCEQKLDFHFLYKPTGAEDIVIKELDFL